MCVSVLIVDSSLLADRLQRPDRHITIVLAGTGENGREHVAEVGRDTVTSRRISDQPAADGRAETA
jgi:hypothetical protein